MLMSSGCAGRGGDVGRVDEFCKVRNKSEERRVSLKAKKSKEAY